MVAVTEITSLNEAGVDDFELDAGTKGTFKGITATWQGAAFQINSMTPQAKIDYPKLKPRGMLSKQLRGGMVNSARASMGLSRLAFDGVGNLKPNPTAGLRAEPSDPRGNQTVVRRPPIGDWDLDDDKMIQRDALSRDQKRTLRSTGQVAIGGYNYTNDDFDAIDTRYRQRSSILMKQGDNVKEKAAQNKAALSTGTGTKMVRALIPNYLGGSLALVDVLRNQLIVLQDEMIAGDMTVAVYNENVSRTVGLWFCVTMFPYVLRVAGGTVVDAGGRLSRVFTRMYGTQRRPTRNSGSWRRWITNLVVKNVGSYLGTKLLLEKESVARAFANTFKSTYIDDQSDTFFSLTNAASLAGALDETIEREFEQNFVKAYRAVKDFSGDIEPGPRATASQVDDAGTDNTDGVGTKTPYSFD